MTAVLAAASGKELWYLTRASGIVALVLLTASVALGVATTGTWERRNWPRFVTQGLHRNVSLLSVVFVALHVGTTVVDGYVAIGWANAVVPFTSPYHRLWLGLGAVSCDLLLAVVLTSVVRRHIRPGTWRGVHWLAYASWPVALLHGLGTGTDATAEVLRVTVAGAVALVVAAAAWRMWRSAPAAQGVRVAGSLALVLTMAGAAFGLTGGFRPRPTVVEAGRGGPGAPPAVPFHAVSASPGPQPEPPAGAGPVGGPATQAPGAGPAAPGPSPLFVAVPAVERVDVPAGDSGGAGASTPSTTVPGRLPAPAPVPTPTPTPTPTPVPAPVPTPTPTPTSTTTTTTTTTTTVPFCSGASCTHRNDGKGTP